MISMESDELARFFGYVNPARHLEHNRGLTRNLVDEILSHIPLPYLRTLSFASKCWYNAVQYFLDRKRSRLLCEYFSSDVGIRNLLRSTGSIASGSEVLDFALHGTTNPAISAGDLDIYANCLYTLQVVLYLRDVEGYSVVLEKKGSDGVGLRDYGENIISVTTLVKTALGRKVQVVCVGRLSPVHQLSLFWSTLVMVLLTADGVVMAYPSLTTAGVGIISPLTLAKPKRQECIDKYRSRGFNISDFDGNAPDELGSCLHSSFATEPDVGHSKEIVTWTCPDVIRSWKDAGCFNMTFAKGEGAAPRWTKPLTSWLMGGTKCGGGCEPDSKPTLWVRGTIALVRDGTLP